MEEARSALRREEVFLVLHLLPVGGPEQKGLQSAFPDVEVQADFVLEHPSEDGRHIVDVLQELVEKTPGLFRRELLAGEAGHVFENGLLGPGNQEWLLPGADEDFSPSSRTTVLFDGAEADDLVGTPILAVAQMDHTPVLDLQCRLPPGFLANLGGLLPGAIEGIPAVRMLH